MVRVLNLPNHKKRAKGLSIVEKICGHTPRDCDRTVAAAGIGLKLRGDQGAPTWLALPGMVQRSRLSKFRNPVVECPANLDQRMPDTRVL